MENYKLFADILILVHKRFIYYSRYKFILWLHLKNFIIKGAAKKWKLNQSSKFPKQLQIQSPDDYTLVIKLSIVIGDGSFQISKDSIANLSHENASPTLFIRRF